VPAAHEVAADAAEAVDRHLGGREGGRAGGEARRVRVEKRICVCARNVGCVACARRARAGCRAGACAIGAARGNARAASWRRRSPRARRQPAGGGRRRGAPRFRQQTLRSALTTRRWRAAGRVAPARRANAPSRRWRRTRGTRTRRRTAGRKERRASRVSGAERKRAPKHPAALDPRRAPLRAVRRAAPSGRGRPPRSGSR
jgi:hypothetical protein